MSEDTIKDISNNGEPSQKRMRLSPTDALPEEIKILESKKIKTGFVRSDKAFVYIDDQKIDLINISSEIVSGALFNGSSFEASEKANIPHPKNHKTVEKQLSNLNDPFLNYLGQMITSKTLGNNYQSIPQELIICEENDFYLSREYIHEDDLSHFLIVVCPTDCEGGEVNFPELKKKFTGKTGKTLSYALFGIKTRYDVLKVTKGLRVMITYKIFERPLEVKREELAVVDAEKLKRLLKDIQENNVLIPVTDVNVVQKACEDAKIKYKLAFAPIKHPTSVYSDISSIEEATEDREFDLLDFDDLLYDEATKFSVGAQIDLLKPKLITDKYKILVKDRSARSESEEISYYSFILINPNQEYHPEKKDGKD